jgi:hypothetical protein
MPSKSVLIVDIWTTCDDYCDIWTAHDDYGDIWNACNAWTACDNLGIIYMQLDKLKKRGLSQVKSKGSREHQMFVESINRGSWHRCHDVQTWHLWRGGKGAFTGATSSHLCRESLTRHTRHSWNVCREPVIKLSTNYVVTIAPLLLDPIEALLRGILAYNTRVPWGRGAALGKRLFVETIYAKSYSRQTLDREWTVLCRVYPALGSLLVFHSDPNSYSRVCM